MRLRFTEIWTCVMMSSSGASDKWPVTNLQLYFGYLYNYRPNEIYVWCHFTACICFRTHSLGFCFPKRLIYFPFNSIPMFNTESDMIFHVFKKAYRNSFIRWYVCRKYLNLAHCSCISLTCCIIQGNPLIGFNISLIKRISMAWL